MAASEFQGLDGDRCLRIERIFKLLSFVGGFCVAVGIFALPALAISSAESTAASLGLAVGGEKYRILEELNLQQAQPRQWLWGICGAVTVVLSILGLWYVRAPRHQQPDMDSMVSEGGGDGT